MLMAGLWHMGHVRYALGLPLSLLALTAACATAPARVLSSSQVRARPVARAEWVQGWDSALATATATMERELEVPRFEVVLHLYPGRDAFEQALLASGYRADFARDTAGTMTAIGGYRAVLINEANLRGVSWDRRLALLAHEVAHSLQYELGGGHRGASDQWLREGFADWVSVRVMERLDGANVEHARQRAQVNLRGRRREPLPALDDMVTFPQWVALGRGPHRDIVYDLAFAAADFLIRRHGAAQAVEYFALFARAQDRKGNFRAAFGEDVRDFERAFRAELSGQGMFDCRKSTRSWMATGLWNTVTPTRRTSGSSGE
jgi:hypothetical protein